MVMLLIDDVIIVVASLVICTSSAYHCNASLKSPVIDTGTQHLICGVTFVNDSLLFALYANRVLVL
jgi:hypothetical protein